MAKVEKAKRAARRSSISFVEAYRPHVAHPERGSVLFTPWPYQQELLHSLDRGGPHVVLKARQIGVSTTVMMYALRRCIEADGRTTVTVSINQDKASELNRIARQAITECDPPYPLKLIVDNTLELEFSNGSRIKTQPATQGTARGLTGANIVLDEFAFMPYQEEIWKAARPAAIRGSNICIISTPALDGDLFADRWAQAQDPASHWHAFKFPWTFCPEYTEAVAEATRSDMTAAGWAQEFCCEFGRTGDAVFGWEYIERAMQLGGLNGKHVGPYAQGADVAGMGRDSSVNVILDTGVTPIQVAEVRHWERLPAAQLQTELEDAATRWCTTPWIDRTGLGWGVVENLSIPAVGLAITGGQEPTGDPRNPNVPRTLLIGALVQALERGMLGISRQYQEVIMGLRSYSWDKRRGRFADFVDALAIAWWQIANPPRKLAPVGDYYQRTVGKR